MKERPYKSKCGKFTGKIFYNEKGPQQCILDEKSQEKLAGINVRLVQEQNGS